MVVRIRGVSIDFIDGLNESAKSTYPDEFICLHRQHDGIIDEMVMLPGTIFGEAHSVLQDWMDPVDFARSGSAHSHPGYSAEASNADLTGFSQMGGVHIITAQPYDRRSWRAYNSSGEAINLPILLEDGTPLEPSSDSQLLGRSVAPKDIEKDHEQA